jgi:hypothetical protein
MHVVVVDPDGKRLIAVLPLLCTMSFLCMLQYLVWRYVCMCVCMCVYVCTCVYVSVFMCVVCVCVYVYMYMCMCLHVYVCMYLCRLVWLVTYGPPF